VVAGRLVKEAGARVLLLEAGPTNADVLLRMPAGAAKVLRKDTYLWRYRTVPQDGLDGRIAEIPQGRVVGGSSSVNGMIYIRGDRSDYDAWAGLTGDAGWSGEAMWERMRRMEGNARFSNAAHGADGPVRVADPAHVCEATWAFLRAAQEAGLSHRADFNDGLAEGCGLFQVTSHRRRRWSAADAYLAPVLPDPNLTLATSATVARLILQGDRCIGVEYAKDGVRHTAFAEQGVVLCAGAIATPKLMMISGIGPADPLGAAGVDVRHRLDGVGRNFHDHLEVPLIGAIPPGLGYSGEDTGWRMLRNGVQHLLFGTGPVATNGVEAGAFLNVGAAGGLPNIQLFCVPYYFTAERQGDAALGGALTLNSCLLRPRSRGTVAIGSDDLFAPPVVDPGYLRDPEDLAACAAAFTRAREIVGRPSLRSLWRAEVTPGPDCRSAEDVARHCRTSAKTVYHPVGSCRMGAADDEGAVVDPHLRVRGLEGLVIADASVMPSIPSGNTNAAVMAVADRAADLLLGLGPPVMGRRDALQLSGAL
jgi:choline dehydrogenase